MSKVTTAHLIMAMLLGPVVGALLGTLAQFGWGQRLRVMLDPSLMLSPLVALLSNAVLIAHSTRLPVSTTLEPLAWFSRDLLLTDGLSLLFGLVINGVVLTVAWNTISYLRSSSYTEPERASFHSHFHLFHLTMLLAVLLNNLVLLWICLQLTTLISARLVDFQKNRPSATEAAWKYLILASTGIIFALFGTVLLANVASRLPNQPPGLLRTELLNWTFLREHLTPTRAIAPAVQAAFLFVLVGYGTKAGLAPFHPWLPDGHGEAPAPISALLSGVLIKAALYAILRFAVLSNQALGSRTFTSGLLLGAGTLSLLVATPFILKANPFKRVLAYHSLEHMGIISFGLGLGSRVALAGALLHVLNHAITKALLFLAHGNTTRAYRLQTADHSEDPSGVLQIMPWTGWIMILGGLALVGTPPSNIFMSKLIIVWGGLGLLLGQPQNTSPLPVWLLGPSLLVFLGTSTLIFFGLCQHLYRLGFGGTPNTPRLPEPGGELLPLLLLLASVIGLGLWVAPPLITLIDQSVQIVSGEAF